MDWLKLFGNEGGVGSIVKSVGDTVAQFVDTPDKKSALEIALKSADLDVRKLQFEAESAYLADRQGARELYAKNDNIQKVYAMTFLLGYMALTVAILWFIVSWIGKDQISIPDWAVALISSIYGAMSTKIGTITDFFFGSSQSSHNKDDQVQTAMSKVPKADS